MLGGKSCGQTCRESH